MIEKQKLIQKLYVFDMAGGRMKKWSVNGVVNEVQGKILEIYKEIKRICDKHQLRYFAIGGTCLGAVRHKGFIPWDDDMDISMPDEDYKRFMEIADAELPDNMKVLESAKFEKCVNTFNKVHNINTTFIPIGSENCPDRQSGIYVDIMPMCGLPSQKILQKMYVIKNKMLYGFNYWRRIDRKPNKLFDKLLYMLIKPVNYFVPFTFWSDLLEKMRAKHRFDKSEYVGFTWSFCPEKRIFEKDLFASYVDLPFEDTVVPCPKRYHEYLTLHYGDYLKLPPEDKRIGMHACFVAVDRSYTDYHKRRHEA